MQDILSNLGNYFNAETLPAWAAALAAAAAVHVARSSNKFNDTTSRASLVRDIIQVDTQTLSLIYQLTNEISSEKWRLRDQMRSTGYSSDDIEELLENAIGSENEKSLRELSVEISENLTSSLSDRNHNELMEMWQELNRQRAQFTQLRSVILARIKNVETIVLGRAAADGS